MKELITKTYCVHIREQAHEYEDIEAETAEEAEMKVMQAFNGMNYDGIEGVEVMLQCECGTDNDVDNKKCDDCGEKL